MPKKRRITKNQAQILAIRYIQVALNREAIHAMDNTPSSYGKCFEYFGDVLPLKWADGQTSAQSWDHVWEETEIQLTNILECFDDMAKQLQKDNTEFRYPVGH